jgi:hypothetical protein
MATVQGGIEMWKGRGSAVTVALEARYDTSLQPVKVTTGNTKSHKSTYGSLIVRNAFDASKSITSASGRGLGHKS